MCPSGRDPRRESAAGDAGFRPAFDVMDADHDGKIGREDLKAFYSGLPSRPSEEDIASMISAADGDRDGFVEFDDFERVLGRRSGVSGGGGGGGVMEDVFRAMDRDGDGKVGFWDLKTYMEWAGMRIRDEEIRAMIRMGGGDEEGVGFEELLKILAVECSRVNGV